MINPNTLKPNTRRWNDVHFVGGKFYIPVLVGNGGILRTRKTFQRASQAGDYATRVLRCWKRVYPMCVARQAAAEKEAVA